MSFSTRREFLKVGGALAAAPALGALSGSSPLWAAPEPYADAKFVEGEPPLPEIGSFTIAVLPDTQNYSQKWPELYKKQTEWIVENRKKRNIVCVLHLGDVTNHNTTDQWENAVAAMNLLDRELPYFMTLGNHDYSQGGKCSDRTTHFNDYFPLAKFKKRREFGGVYDKEPDRFENSFHTFSAGERDFLVLSLEFGAREDVVRWANEIAEKHKDRGIILITHAWMYFDETRYDWSKYGENQLWNPHKYPVAAATNGDINDAEEIWNKLVSKHENFLMTLNGHVLRDGLGRMTSATPGGREIPQMLVNFQMKPNGGDGWLRLLEMRADGKTAQTFDYSPSRNQCNASPQNQFEISLSPPKLA